MDNSNLPDNCQGSDPNFPWNEPEEFFCPWCDCGTSMQGDQLHCDNINCDYVEEPDEYEPEDY